MRAKYVTSSVVLFLLSVTVSYGWTIISIMKTKPGGNYQPNQNEILLKPSQTIKTSLHMGNNRNIFLAESNNYNNSTVTDGKHDTDSKHNIAGDTIVFCVTKKNSNKADNRKNRSNTKRQSKASSSVYAPASSTNNNGYDGNAAGNEDQSSRKRSNGYRKIKNGGTSGLIPDIEWRAISMDHLRKHPNFKPLPTKISKLRNIEDINLFRQDSWQWDELHVGRCTTSIASSALGFLDPIASDILNVPLSFGLRYSKLGISGGMKAYYRLSNEISMVTLDDFNRELCSNSTMVDTPHPTKNKRNKVIWRKQHNSSYVAKYIPTITKAMQRQRKNQVKHIMPGTDISQIRMKWGSIQEATAILTAINYFSNSKLKEVGMCHNYPKKYYDVLSSIGLYLGASPDAIISHEDGTSEILEVKNHCPFMYHKQSNRFRVMRPYPLKKRGSSNSTSNDKFTPMTSIQAMYIPQLMLEMFCYSENCTSAIMLRQTIHGAYILRIKRDDKYIDQMIHWLSIFHKEYVLKQNPPPINLFWKEYPEYRKFVYTTKYLAEQCVEVVDFVSGDCIQRMDGSSGRNISLFLDYVK